jgi:pimeloyl-ACP methyl ester carboxylesterase
MNPSQADTLKVPGAALHYEIRGSGPVLLLIPGGPADGGVFAPIRELLADRYTVVTYDPRGLSRTQDSSSHKGTLPSSACCSSRQGAVRLRSAVCSNPP